MCLPFTGSVLTPYVRIRATYYIDLPAETQLEIDEVDIVCTKDLCNSIDIVENLKGQIQNQIDINPDFQPTRPPNTTSATETTTNQGSQSTETTTNPGSQSTETTTNKGSKSTKTYFILALELFVFLLLL